MAVEAFRIQNFMGFENSGWIEVRPITLLFGRNSSGKSAIIRSLLLLRQSLDSPTERGALLFVRDDGFDFGDYREIVRNHEPSLAMSFWFKCRFRKEDQHQYDTRALEALNQIGEPANLSTKPEVASVTVRFICSQDSTQPCRLLGLDVLDDKGDLILRGSRGDSTSVNGTEWVFLSEFFDFQNQPEPNLWPYMEAFTKTGFLPWIRPLQSRLAQAEEIEPDEDVLGKAFHLIWLVLRGIRHSVTTFLEGVKYMGPLRAEPQRFYYVAGLGATASWRGQHLVRSLVNSEPDLLQTINEWLVSSGFGIQIQLTPLDTRQTLYELRLAEPTQNADQLFTANLREVGFGLTQALPIVGQAMLAASGDTLITEQPELHLHPRAQAELGDLFITIAQQGVYSLIETHSEHLLLRLQRQIARTTAGMIPTEFRKQMLLPNQLAVYFINRRYGVSTATNIEVGPYGDLQSTPEGSEDFFSDDMIETAERMRTRLMDLRRIQ